MKVTSFDSIAARQRRGLIGNYAIGNYALMGADPAQPAPTQPSGFTPSMQNTLATKTWAQMTDAEKTKVAIWGVLSTASAAASAYHGYKRNNSVGWAIWWGLMGGMFPVITPAIGLAQGWSKRAR